MNAIERLESLTVGDIMTEMVVQAPVEQSMTDVARTMRKHHVSLVPVVNERGQAIGVLSAYDFVVREAERASEATRTPAAGLPARGAAAPGRSAGDLVAGDTAAGDGVGDHMTRSIQSIPADASVLEAARMLFSEHLHRLLVLDGQGRPRGVVSTMDVIAAVVNAVEEMRLAEAVDD